MAHRQRTVAQLAAAVQGYGFALVGRASKVISDGLRWEVRRGRVRRLARGVYGYVTAPVSTARRLRIFAACCRYCITTTPPTGWAGNSPGRGPHPGSATRPAFWATWLRARERTEPPPDIPPPGPSLYRVVAPTRTQHHHQPGPAPWDNLNWLWTT